MANSNPPDSGATGMLSGAGSPPVLDLGLIRSIFHTSPDFIVRLDARGKVTYINQVFEEHGDPNNVLGLAVIDFLEEPSKRVMRRAMERAKQRRNVESIEVQMLLGVWLQVRLFPVWQEEVFDGYV